MTGCGFRMKKTTDRLAISVLTFLRDVFTYYFARKCTALI